jgi:hypothetical protein
MAAAEARQAQDRVTRAGQAARAQGASWSDIGAAAGITRQSAHEQPALTAISGQAPEWGSTRASARTQPAERPMDGPYP